jgi:alpha-beta hydrolase superfamily lysophospholipase
MTTKPLATTNLQLNIDTITDHSGQFDLRYTFIEPSKRIKSYIVFVNGRTEWIEKYPDLFSWLDLPDDVGFLTWEHRGQGGSGGQRAYVEHYGAYGADAAKIIHHVVGDHPYHIVAHSMGSLISLFATMSRMIQPQSLSLCSPLLRLPGKPLPLWFALPTSRLISWAGLGKLRTGAGKHDKVPFELNKLTQDKAAFDRIQANPFPCHSATYEWVYRSFQAIAYCHDPEHLKNFETPTLLIGGTDERVVDNAGAEEWIKRAQEHSAAHIESYWVQNGRHELFSEIEPVRMDAVHRIRQWLESH